MTTLREAATQALEAMEGGADSWQLVGPAIDALKEALVEDAMQKFTDVNQELEAALTEPVPTPKHATVAEWWADKQCPNCASLENQNTELDRKLAEMKRKPLSEEEAIALWADKSDGPSNGEIVSFTRAIERAHGII